MDEDYVNDCDKIIEKLSRNPLPLYPVVDVGYFYCPYIPLMHYKTANTDNMEQNE